MPTKAKPPSDAELIVFLSSASGLWTEIVRTLEEGFPPLIAEWRPSKAAFGRICLLQQRRRTLLYLTPESGCIRIAIVLGDRAYAVAMASTLPAAIKKLFSEARPYAEGRGIRFTVNKSSDIPVVRKLVEIKTMPK
jgi:hypothetical protein